MRIKSCSEDMNRYDQGDFASRIARATAVDETSVREVVRLVLEELHRISIVHEKGPTAAVMETCFSFGAEAAFHLTGIYACEHDYHGRHDDAGAWAELAMRFIPTAYREGCDRIAPWFSQKTAARLKLEAADDVDSVRRGHDHNVSQPAGAMDVSVEEVDPLAERFAAEHRRFLEENNPSVLSKQDDPESYLSSAGSLAAESFRHQVHSFKNSPEQQKLPHLDRMRALQNYLELVGNR